MKPVTKVIVIIWMAMGLLIEAIPIYLLWNWLMPEIFRLPEITFWQALGLNLLAWIFFKPTNIESNKR